jgi:GNAT superfamily N-acetyltransferase
MSELLSYEIARLAPSELNMVLKSWKKSYREAVPDQRTDDFYLAQGNICDAILARFPVLLTARAPSGVALGWICGESTDKALVLHYANVKSAYRRNGVFKALLAALIDECPDAGPVNLLTHVTRRAHIVKSMGFVPMSIGQFLRENP